MHRATQEHARCVRTQGFCFETAGIWACGVLQVFSDSAGLFPLQGSVLATRNAACTHWLLAARMHGVSSLAVLPCCWRAARTALPLPLPLQTQAPVLEADDDSGEDLVAESLRQLQESINEVQLKHDRAEMELNEAKLNEAK